MPSLSCATHFCFAVGGIVALLGTCEQADAQFYRFGPRGGVSIQSPFFSLNVPSSPYLYDHGHYDHGHYGHGHYDHGYYGPSIAVPPIPSYRNFQYRYPSPSSLSYSYRGYGHPYAPGISRFQYEGGAIPFGPGGDTSLRYSVPETDPYAYRGNAIHPNDTYSAGRVPMDSNLPMDSNRIDDELRLAAEQLRQSLASRPNDSDVWLEYLDPDSVIDSLDVTRQADAVALQERLAELADHYDGVADNPELRGVSTTPGFERTRQLLRQWVEAQAGGDTARENPRPQPVTEPDVNAVEPGNTLPAPEPDATTDATNAPQPKTRRSL